MYGYRKRYGRYNKKRRYTRRGKKVAWYNRKYTAKDLAVNAWKGVQYVRNLINCEVHKNDQTFNATAFTSAGVIYNNADQIAIGDTYDTRTGNSILCKGLSYRWLCAQSVANAMCRMIYFIDNQQIADTSPAVTDVLLSASPTSPLNPLTVGRFTILRDYNFELDSVAKPLKVIKGYIPLTRHHMRYNGSLTSDIQKGTIYMLCIASTNACTFAGNMRLSFYDN